MSDANATHKIVIPLFDPDKNDVTAKTWMAFVSMAIKAAGTLTEGAGEAARQVNNWTESMAANHAILTLRGGASRWIETLIEEENPAVNSWTELQKLFKARFCEKHTLSEKVKLMDLRQGAKESVMDFYDKVKSNVHQWYSEDWVEANTDADKAAKTKSLQMHVKLSFAAGLRPSIQKDTIIQDCNTVEELITVAMRVEASKKDNRDAHVNAGQAQGAEQEEHAEEAELEVDEDGGAVAAVNARNGARPKFSRGPSSNGQRNSRPTSSTTKFQGTCNYCFKKYHKHVNCFKRQNNERRGVFCENVNAVPRQAAPIEAEAEMSSIEMDNYLNMYSA